MGKNDTALKVWLSDKKRFADLFNGTLFQGKQIINHACLETENNEENELINNANGHLVNIERNRDIVMRWNDKIHFAILACENQDKIHYGMPVRTMIYDGLGYAEQIRQLSKKRIVQTKDEFLSGITKEDKLHPIITLVLYYGEKEWDGSTSIYDLLEKTEDPETDHLLMQLIPNYHINLLEINKLQDTTQFKTDLQVIFGMLKYRHDKNKIKHYITHNESYFKSMDLDTYNVLRVLLGAEKQLKAIRNNEEDINMCEALQGIFDDGKLQGKLEGRLEGKLEGRFEGRIVNCTLNCTL